MADSTLIYSTLALVIPVSLALVAGGAWWVLRR